MELGHYVDEVREQLGAAAAAGGSDAAALAARLTAPLEAAIRLALLEALSAAAQEITRELAPTAVDVRLRGRDPEFVVVPAIDEVPDVSPLEPDDGGTWRVTLRLPAWLRANVEAAARRDGISLNAWLVRAAATAADPAVRNTGPGPGQHVTGWVR